MGILDQWLMLNPSVKTSWILKGFLSTFFILIFILFPLFFFGWLGIIIFIIVIVIINCIIIVWALMFYDRYRYKIGDKTLDIKRGILWKRDVTIPYERIQHVSSTRGPIEQLLGLHIVNIFTAGTASFGAGFGGSAGMFAAEGYIPGITDPDGLRKIIMDRVKMSKSGSGLGDTVDIKEKPQRITKTKDLEILDELRKIRKLLEKGRA